MAFCGSDCTITSSEFSDATVEGHTFTVSLSSNEIDIRNFSSGEYGDYIACNKNGTISVNSYERPSVDVGDEVTFEATLGTALGDETISVPCVITGQDFNVDSKGVVEFTTNLRLAGDLTIGSVSA